MKYKTINDNNKLGLFPEYNPNRINGDLIAPMFILK